MSYANLIRPYISVFASSLGPHTDFLVNKLMQDVVNYLAPLGVVPQFQLFNKSHILPTDLPPNIHKSKYHMCLMATGGSETKCLEFVHMLHKRSPEKPFIMFTHPDLNSFAAGLEAKAKLLIESKPIHFFNLADTNEIDNLFTILKVRERLTEEGKQVGKLKKPDGTVMDKQLARLRKNDNDKKWGVNFMQKTIDWKELFYTYEEIPDNAPEMEEVKKYLNEKKSEILPECAPDEFSYMPIYDNSKLCVALKRIVKKYNLSSLVLHGSDLEESNVPKSLLVAYLNDIGIPSACEGDVMAIMTMMLAHNITGLPSFIVHAEFEKGKNLYLKHWGIPTRITRDYSLKSNLDAGKRSTITENNKNEYKTWTLSRANIRKNCIDCEEVLVHFKEPKGNERCTTQLAAEFKDITKLWNYLYDPLESHHVLTAGNWTKLIKLYAKLFLDSVT